MHLSARATKEWRKVSLYIRLYCIRVPRPNVRYPSLRHHLQRLSAKYPRACPNSAGLMDRRRVPALRGEAPVFARRYFPGPAMGQITNPFCPRPGFQKRLDQRLPTDGRIFCRIVRDRGSDRSFNLLRLARKKQRTGMMCFKKPTLGTAKKA
jgi:hypothetical protein